MERTEILEYKSEITGTYLRVADEIAKDLEIANENITGSKFENMVFENVIFRDCSFQSTDFLSTKFIDCKFINCDFGFVKFNNCNLIACKFESCDFCITNSLNCNFLSCTYIKNSWEASKIVGNFHNCFLEENDENAMDIISTSSHLTETLSSNNQSNVA